MTEESLPTGEFISVPCGSDQFGITWNRVKVLKKSGGLCVHKAADLLGEHLGIHVVTHESSGYCIIQCKNYQLAVDAMRAFLALGFDWTVDFGKAPEAGLALRTRLGELELLKSCRDIVANFQRQPERLVR